jgi:four helix bundle protein
MKKYDLEEKLIDFADLALTIVDELPNKYSANHLGHQLARSGTSPALNYGEAQAAESSNDFIHKMKVCLKELRESSVNLKIISKRGYFKNLEYLEKVKKESIELIAIFTASINTAKSKKSAK